MSSLPLHAPAYHDAHPPDASYDPPTEICEIETGLAEMKDTLNLTAGPQKQQPSKEGEIPQESRAGRRKGYQPEGELDSG